MFDIGEVRLDVSSDVVRRCQTSGEARSSPKEQQGKAEVEQDVVQQEVQQEVQQDVQQEVAQDVQQDVQQEVTQEVAPAEEAAQAENVCVFQTGDHVQAQCEGT